MKAVTKYVCDYCGHELPTERGMAGHEARRCFFSPGSHSCATCHHHIGVKNGSRWYDSDRYTTECEFNQERQGREDGAWYAPREVKNCPYYREIDYNSPDARMVGHVKNYWLREVESLHMRGE
jgi:hypothetical protein